MFIYFVTSENNAIQWLKATLSTEGYLEKIEQLDETATVTQNKVVEFPLMAYDFQDKGYFGLNTAPGFGDKKTSELLLRHKYQAEYERYMLGEKAQITDNKVCWSLAFKENGNCYPLRNQDKVLTDAYAALSETLQKKLTELQKLFEQLTTAPSALKMNPCDAIEQDSKKLLTALERQDDKFSFLVCVAEGATPALFCAVVLSLLKVGKTAQEIFDTGILDAFFREQINHVNDIKQAYQWLRALEGQYPELKILCQLASQHKVIFSGRDVGNLLKLALDGSFVSIDKWNEYAVSQTSAPLPLTMSVSQENLTTLHASFNEDLLYWCLTKTTSEHWSVLEPALSSFLNTLPVESSNEHIKKLLPQCIKNEQMSRLLPLCQKGHQAVLIREHFPQLMRCKATLRTFLTPEVIAEKMNTLVITKDNVKDVSAFAYQPEFQCYHSSLHRKIADFLLGLSAGEREIFYRESQALETSSHLSDWAKTKASDLHAQLETIANSNPELTEQSFVLLDDAYKQYVSALSFFKLIRKDVSENRPTTPDAFKAWVLEHAAKQDTFDLMAGFDVIFRYINVAVYSTDEQVRARIKCVGASQNDTLKATFLTLLFNGRLKTYHTATAVAVTSCNSLRHFRQ